MEISAAVLGGTQLNKIHKRMPSFKHTSSPKSNETTHKLTIP